VKASPAETGLGTVREVDAGLDVPLRMHAAWAERWPWLVQGITWRGPAGDFDLGLSGVTPVATILERWRSLQHSIGTASILHARQVHGAAVETHDGKAAGLTILDGFDGHHTAARDLTLTVSVADCVPVSIVDPLTPAVTLVHAGWRGIAAGIIERGIRVASESAGGDTARLHVHFGPAICGDCYEVGPEVHQKLGLAPPPRPEPVDLRLAGSARAIHAGVPAGAVTISVFCTRCDPDRPFYSHRAGDAGRQMAVLGIRRT
jgi:copper oxidase (laccase) domain-containing protein